MVYGIRLKIETDIPIPDCDRSVHHVLMNMISPPYYRKIDGDQMVYEPFDGGFYLTMIHPYEIETGKWLDKHTCEFIHHSRVVHVEFNSGRRLNVIKASAEYAPQKM